jgi:hypothetical protein
MSASPRLELPARRYDGALSRHEQVDGGSVRGLIAVITRKRTVRRAGFCGDERATDRRIDSRIRAEQQSGHCAGAARQLHGRDLEDRLRRGRKRQLVQIGRWNLLYDRHAVRGGTGSWRRTSRWWRGGLFAARTPRRAVAAGTSPRFSVPVGDRWLPAWASETLDLEILIRLAYSALVDSDTLDAAEHQMTGAEPRARPEPRFTPTRVATTTRWGRRTKMPAVHPHACGDDSTSCCESVCPSGSPPRVCGRLFMGDCTGFTPTRVGTTR